MLLPSCSWRGRWRRGSYAGPISGCAHFYVWALAFVLFTFGGFTCRIGAFRTQQQVDSTSAGRTTLLLPAVVC